MLGPHTATPGSGEGHQDVLVTANVLLKGGVSEHDYLARRRHLLLRPDARLFGDEGRKALQVPPAVVLGRLVALAVEPLQRRETLHAEALAQSPLGIGVDLCDLDLVLGEFERLGELLVNGSEILAVAAPRGEELDEGRLSGLEDDLIEIIRDEVENGRFGGSGGRKAGEHEALDKHHGDLTTASQTGRIGD